jgi:lia operon protein LiaG
MPRFSIRFLLLLGVPAGLQAQQQPERYTLDDQDVAIYNLVGAVRVEAGEGGVAVEVARAGADAGRLRVAQGELDGRSTLRVIYPEDRIRAPAVGRNGSTTLRVRDDGTFGDRIDDHERGRRGHDAWDEGRRVTIAGGAGLDARADLTVRVARGRRVTVVLAVGSVTAANVEGDLVLETQAADVVATGVKGRLRIDGGSSSVRASDIEGDLSVDTGSGSVEVSRVRGTALSIDTGSGDVTGSDLEAGELSVDSGSGDIRLTGVGAPRLALETGSGGVSAELRRDVTLLRVETGSGDIAIRAPASLGAQVEIETASGDIETDFPLQVTRHGRDHTVGTIGDGKGMIAIETGSGQIRLLKGPK